MNRRESNQITIAYFISYFNLSWPVSICHECAPFVVNELCYLFLSKSSYGWRCPLILWVSVPNLDLFTAFSIFFWFLHFFILYEMSYLTIPIRASTIHSWPCCGWYPILFLAVLTLWYTRARICKPFKEPRNRFLNWRSGTITLFDVTDQQLHRLAESMIDSFGIDSWTPYTFKNSGSKTVEWTTLLWLAVPCLVSTSCCCRRRSWNKSIFTSFRYYQTK